MSDVVNPYKSPEASTEVIKPLTVQGTLSETMLKYLSDSSPWLRFIGIVGFIGSGLFVLGGLIAIIVSPILSSLG